MQFDSTYVISGFRREADWNCALLGCYAACSGDFVPTFRENLSIPSSGAKNLKENRDGVKKQK